MNFSCSFFYRLSLVWFGRMKDFIIRGPKSSYKPIPKGYAEYFFDIAEEFKDNILQIDGTTDESETYGQVKARSIKVALAIKKLGLKPKDVVLLCCKNDLNNIIPVLGTLYLGGYVSSAHPKQSLDDVKYFLGLVQPKLLFVDQDSVGLVEKAMELCGMKATIVVVGNSDKYPTMRSMESRFYEEEKSFSPIKQKGNDIAFILFTSGTTSSPKGIYISNRSALEGGRLIIENGYTKPGVLMNFTSFYWVSTLLVTSKCFLTGSTRILGNSISAEKYLNLVEKYKITYTFMSNSFTYGISSLGPDIIKKYDTSSLYSVLVGGATVNPAQILKLREVLPYTKVAMGYGSTETSFISCFDFQSREAYESKLESSGKLLADVELKIVDVDTGKLLGPNQEGEIRLKTPYLMCGYHNLDKTDSFDEDGFLKMSDLGYYDIDHYIYVTDRIKEMFKYQGNQVSPSTIENSLLSHPSVEEAVVFGVPHRIDNNHPAALVVVKPGQRLEAKELIDFTDLRLADTHRLRGGVIIVNSIPKTPTGKAQRRSLKEMFGKKAR
ncbi:4-coumarate--CoA ligase 1-like isoform X1 [Sitophilus oryzae]|uniref:4-coumarate--CoA ligase 1-like isoform X1 n=1 Tax=Sitophilus oryzae TaxID=7048 RepID=A0A6J2YWM9_SITOR|nr:4-coumarate--CoA ligase 1-like isoform X1 [Sitophilus oryzae]